MGERLHQDCRLSPEKRTEKSFIPLTRLREHIRVRDRISRCWVFDRIRILVPRQASRDKTDVDGCSAHRRVSMPHAWSNVRIMGRLRWQRGWDHRLAKAARVSETT